MLPDIDGNEVCRTLRQNEETRRIPILMLTARSEEIDRVLGFELGADDYVTKPFSPRELVLRVKSILRRGKDQRPSTLQAGAIRMELAKRQCFVGEESVALTPKEFDLLSELMKAGGNVLTREDLLERIWGYHGDATSRTLDTHIRRLREKLGGQDHRVETVRGIGFRIAV
jgi:two-component system phosphate regulon response regulator PhoB